MARAAALLLASSVLLLTSGGVLAVGCGGTVTTDSGLGGFTDLDWHPTQSKLVGLKGSTGNTGKIFQLNVSSSGTFTESVMAGSTTTGYQDSATLTLAQFEEMHKVKWSTGGNKVAVSSGTQTTQPGDTDYKIRVITLEPPGVETVVTATNSQSSETAFTALAWKGTDTILYVERNGTSHHLRQVVASTKTVFEHMTLEKSDLFGPYASQTGRDTIVDMVFADDKTVYALAHQESAGDGFIKQEAHILTIDLTAKTVTTLVNSTKMIKDIFAFGPQPDVSDSIAISRDKNFLAVTFLKSIFVARISDGKVAEVAESSQPFHGVAWNKHEISDSDSLVFSDAEETKTATGNMCSSGFVEFCPGGCTPAEDTVTAGAGTCEKGDLTPTQGKCAKISYKSAICKFGDITGPATYLNLLNNNFPTTAMCQTSAKGLCEKTVGGGATMKDTVTCETLCENAASSNMNQCTTDEHCASMAAVNSRRCCTDCKKDLGNICTADEAVITKACKEKFFCDESAACISGALVGGSNSAGRAFLSTPFLLGCALMSLALGSSPHS